jgi:hypothetical protein
MSPASSDLANGALKSLQAESQGWLAFSRRPHGNQAMVANLEVVSFLGVQMDGKFSRVMKIELGSRADEIWRIIAALFFCLVCLGCATPRVQVTAEIVDAKHANSRSVAVVADAFMDNPDEADSVAGMLRHELALHGFKVEQSEDAAELIVIPTIERSAIGATAPPTRIRRPFEASLGESSVMKSQNALRSLGFEFGTLPTVEEPRIGLMVTAVSRKIWFNALLEPQTEVPRVWRIVAITAARKWDVTPNLVEAVGDKLDEITAARGTAAEPTPTPPNAPEKKPRKAGRASRL